VADPLEDRQCSWTRKRHEPAVAQLDGTLGRARVDIFSNGDEVTALDHKAAIAGRVFRAKAEHHNRRSFGESLTYASEGPWPNKRRIAENHEHVIGGARKRGFCGEHGMSSSAALRLYEDLGVGQDAFGLSRHRIGAEPDHHSRHRAARLAYGVEDMG